ncbi:uncharacterized protein BDR25DRAFT_351112 [Lindgomyces ingoldianus]|uniref:Uncharacterized protein n=1 Tax=Lindgomyces ingoldianus TaxID=673940 RepID=A0ACB6R7S8_9PLEO|nr:uncharacterized protein BDR25DRAFT_351112 [Lindgomyces ingoldianus]KAF2474582.1 hypothetical protein BDR25DRAFT_351112 [Lindgomyces ingoldianus]
MKNTRLHIPPFSASERGKVQPHNIWCAQDKSWSSRRRFYPASHEGSAVSVYTYMMGGTATATVYLLITCIEFTISITSDMDTTILSCSRTKPAKQFRILGLPLELFYSIPLLYGKYTPRQHLDMTYFLVALYEHPNLDLNLDNAANCGLYRYFNDVVSGVEYTTSKELVLHAEYFQGTWFGEKDGVALEGHFRWLTGLWTGLVPNAEQVEMPRMWLDTGFRAEDVFPGAEVVAWAFEMTVSVVFKDGQ